MCTGPRCTIDGEEAEAMFGRLGEEIDARPDLRIKRTRTHCMVACKRRARSSSFIRKACGTAVLMKRRWNALWWNILRAAAK